MRRLDKSLGRIIEVERVKSGLTQDVLAGACGISRRHLANIEAGANFSVAILLQFARVLPAMSPAIYELLQRQRKDGHNQACVRSPNT